MAAKPNVPNIQKSANAYNPAKSVTASCGRQILGTLFFVTKRSIPSSPGN